MKLQFEENEYYLMKYGEELAIATTDESFIKELGAEMLSRENCEAIKNGYDLDELAENHALEVYDKVEAETEGIILKKGSKKHYLLKIINTMLTSTLGDKKFGEFLDREKELGISDIKTIERIQWYYNTYFDKSQQTEWDVVFNPDEKDSEGCLILKRR